MILDDPRGRPGATRIGGRATLDGLLRQAAQRRPDAIALIDPINRERFTDGWPRSLTYAQADHIVSAIAGRLLRLGLRTDAIVGLQIANTVESVLTLLGVLRAGLIAMPLPLLWRRAEAVAALSHVGVNALVVSGRIGTTDHFDLAMQIGAEIFPVRFVCGYGSDAPDGVVSFDDLFAADTIDPVPSLEDERAGGPGPAAHLAVITWDLGAEGPIPVARSHAELIAGGLAVVLESAMKQEPVLLTTLTMSSFASLAVALVPWLVRGGTLVLRRVASPRRQRGAQQVLDLGVDAAQLGRREAVRYRHRARTARDPACRVCELDGERDQCRRRLARPRADGPRPTLVRSKGAHDRRAGLRRDRPRRRRPRAGRHAGRDPVQRGACATQSRRQRRGSGDRANSEPHRGPARADGAAHAVPAGRGAQRRAPSQDRPHRLRRYRLCLPP